jgi:hypothetical protein
MLQALMKKKKKKKGYGEAEVYLHAFLILALDGGV